MKIAKLLRMVALTLLAFSVLNAVTLFFQLQRMQRDAKVVNFAGIVRGGTQRLVKLELSGKQADELSAKLDKIIAGLVVGSEALGLPRATDSAFIERMNEVAKAWDGLKRLVAAARGEKAQQAALITASEEYFELTNKAVSAAEAFSKGMVTMVIVIQVALLLLNLVILAGIWIISERKISRPLTTVTRQIGIIADGNLSVEIPERSIDEIGKVSEAMRTMLDKLKAMFLQIQKAADEVSRASSVQTRFATDMSMSAAQTSERSNTVAAASEEMSANMRAVAATMEESTANVNTVASSTEELTTTVQEIAKDSTRARGIMEETVNQANAVQERVNELGRSAKDIGKISESISAISAQTNLLALNATIEAARAGAAGKGFAVVANEIKELAKQTAGATEDIKARIESIQTATSENVAEIEKIIVVIRQVYDIIDNVAALVEMQSTALKEIAKSIAQTAQGIHDVNGNVTQSSAASSEVAKDIAQVNVSAVDISEASGRMKTNAQDLERLAKQMEDLIGQFKV